ncbi:MAG: methylmalonyl Co-A mutase-associated GTPase MeaB [Planctomycetota bacterium]|jgi:LAO/AO transport system kinase
MSVDALAEGVRDGDGRALARALTVVENDPEAGAALLTALAPGVGRAHRVGITGPPGAGKSTLLGALAGDWRDRGRSVGVLAVDPTSPFTGGALLGDRIRMAAHTGDEGVFIRSVATRGALGGLSATVEDAADVLDAAGFDPVVIETVGVGQGEIEVAQATDTTVVVLAPGAGDEIQAMKAGLLEVADLLVVNQADRPEAVGLVRALEAALELRRPPKPDLLRTVATTGEGVEALAAKIDARQAKEHQDDVRARRVVRAARRIRSVVDRRRAATWWAAHEDALETWAADVVAGRSTAAAAVAALLAIETETENDD